VVAETIENYVNGIERAGNPNQTPMFASRTPTKVESLEEAYEAAKRTAERDAAGRRKSSGAEGALSRHQSGDAGEGGGEVPGGDRAGPAAAGGESTSRGTEQGAKPGLLERLTIERGRPLPDSDEQAARDSTEALMGMIDRARSDGRIVTIDQLIGSQRGAAETVGKLRERYREDPRVTFHFLDNGADRTSEGGIEVAIPQNYTESRKLLDDILDREYAGNRISEATYRRIRGSGPEPGKPPEGGDRGGSGGSGTEPPSPAETRGERPKSGSGSVTPGSGLGAFEPFLRESIKDMKALKAKRDAAIAELKRSEITPGEKGWGAQARHFFTGERDLWGARANQGIAKIRKVLGVAKDKRGVDQNAVVATIAHRSCFCPRLAAAHRCGPPRCCSTSL
jgi:hypothetical protein